MLPPPNYRWLRIVQLVLFGVATISALAGKWLLAADNDVPDWLFLGLVMAIVLLEAFEIIGRWLRRRSANPGEDPTVEYVEPRGSGPPGWEWDARRATWRAPDQSI